MNWLGLFLSLIGLFLSSWIIIPPPTLKLLCLRVIVLELCPWLFVANTIVFTHILFFNVFPGNVLKANGYELLTIVLVTLTFNTLGLIFSFLPLAQMPDAKNTIENEIRSVLGQDYLDKIPPELQSKFRPKPFIFADVFRGIAKAQICIDRGIEFASPDGITLKLNHYRPQENSNQKYPTLVIIYGGAWRSGSPDHYERFSCYIAAQGYGVLTIDYRHAPEYQFPTQLEDVKTALVYIRDHADELGVDRERVAVMGRSAGAHLAMLVAYQTDILPFRAVVNYYGPTDLKNGYYEFLVPDPIGTQKVLNAFLGGPPTDFPDRYHHASPINSVKPNLPPSLFVYAGRDYLVQAKFGRKMAEKMCIAGNQVVLLEIPWAEHIFDAVFYGVSNQLTLYYVERFIAWALYPAKLNK